MIHSMLYFVKEAIPSANDNQEEDAVYMNWPETKSFAIKSRPDVIIPGTLTLDDRSFQVLSNHPAIDSSSAREVVLENLTVTDRIDISNVFLPTEKQGDGSASHGIYLVALEKAGSQFVAIPHFRKGFVNLLRIADLKERPDDCLHEFNGNLLHKITRPGTHNSHHLIGTSNLFWTLSTQQ